MLLAPKKKKAHPAAERLRATLRSARETYRRHEPHRPRKRPPEPPARRDEPDVLLDVPTLHVDEIDLQLDELKARVALQARVLDLLRLDVGVGAELRGVKLEIKGVDAQALLKVRLENLTTMVDRLMSTIDADPQILEHLTDRLGTTLDDVGGVARALAPGVGGHNGGSPAA
jgi:hypothetical protein